MAECSKVPGTERGWRAGSYPTSRAETGLTGRSRKLRASVGEGPVRRAEKRKQWGCWRGGRGVKLGKGHGDKVGTTSRKSRGMRAGKGPGAPARLQPTLALSLQILNQGAQPVTPSTPTLPLFLGCFMRQLGTSYTR